MLLAPAIMTAEKDQKKAAKKCFDAVGLDPDSYRIGHTKARYFIHFTHDLFFICSLIVDCTNVGIYSPFHSGPWTKIYQSFFSMSMCRMISLKFHWNLYTPQSYFKRDGFFLFIFVIFFFVFEFHNDFIHSWNQFFIVDFWNVFKTIISLIHHTFFIQTENVFKTNYYLLLCFNVPVCERIPLIYFYLNEKKNYHNKIDIAFLLLKQSPIKQIYRK